MDPRFIEIVSVKPELITQFPPWMLSDSTINQLRDKDGLAILEIAGRDSIAAALKASEERLFKALLPTLAYTGTEFGNWEVPIAKINLLKETLEQRGIEVFDPVLLGAPRMWHRLCGRYATHLFKKFGFYSPCVGCHLYLHAIRIPLAKKINCRVVIGGERESHQGKIKINQIGKALDHYVRFTESFGIELLLPLRKVISNNDISSIVGRHWGEDDEQLECVLSKNYLEEDGSVTYTEDSISKFFSEFALKEAENAIHSFLSDVKR